MMIDFALDRRRQEHKSAEDAIYGRRRFVPVPAPARSSAGRQLSSRPK